MSGERRWTYLRPKTAPCRPSRSRSSRSPTWTRPSSELEQAPSSPPAGPQKHQQSLPKSAVSSLRWPWTPCAWTWWAGLGPNRSSFDLQMRTISASPGPFSPPLSGRRQHQLLPQAQAPYQTQTPTTHRRRSLRTSPSHHHRRTVPMQIATQPLNLTRRRDSRTTPHYSTCLCVRGENYYRQPSTQIDFE